MYGKGLNSVVPGTVLTAAVMPVTGVNSAIQIALAAAAGLAVWAMVYVAGTKFSKR